MQRVKAVGIDVGKGAVDLCLAHNESPKDWEVTHIEFKVSKGQRWDKCLLDACEGGVVVLEPTGWHLSAPIIALLAPVADVWIADNSITGMIRANHVSPHKTDKQDSRALAWIAREIAAGKTPRRVRQYSDTDRVVHVLRLLCNERLRRSKERTRALNRFKAFAYGIHPGLSPINTRAETYLRYAAEGVVSVADLHAVDLNTAGARRPELIRRRAQTFDIPTDELLLEITQREARRVLALDAEISDLDARITAVLDRPTPLLHITELWRSVPFLNDVGVAALHVATNGRAAHMDEDQFKAATGQYPLLHASGQTQRGKVSRRGYRPAMNALFSTTRLMLADKNNAVYAHYAQVKARKGKGRNAASAKLAKILSAMARNGTTYQYPYKRGEA